MCLKSTVVLSSLLDKSLSIQRACLFEVESVAREDTVDFVNLRVPGSDQSEVAAVFVRTDREVSGICIVVY
jgi:hypothetical protein